MWNTGYGCARLFKPLSLLSSGLLGCIPWPEKRGSSGTQNHALFRLIEERTSENQSPVLLAFIAARTFKRNAFNRMKPVASV
jgi:hypothetical protein